MKRKLIIPLVLILSLLAGFSYPGRGYNYPHCKQSNYGKDSICKQLENKRACSNYKAQKHYKHNNCNR